MKSELFVCFVIRCHKPWSPRFHLTSQLDFFLVPQQFSPYTLGLDLTFGMPEKRIHYYNYDYLLI